MTRNFNMISKTYTFPVPPGRARDARSPARCATLLSGLVAGITLASAATAAAATVAVVAPLSGPYEVLGRQIVKGAEAAGRAAGVEIVTIDESCEAGSGAAIAKNITEARASAAIGFLCSESLDGAMPPLAEAGIAAISVSVRWNALMEDARKFGWPLFRLAPRPEAESDKAVEVILSRWPGAPIALIEDGTIRGRELVDAIRARLEENGLKPVFVDTFRPGQEQQIALVRRLEKAGATHVFIGGDRNDVSIIARDAAVENIALTLIGGETMRAADQPVQLPDGVYAITLPDLADQETAGAAVTALRAENVAPEGYVLPAYAAVQIAAAADARKPAPSDAADAPSPVEQAMTTAPFETALGSIRFGADHELSANPYRLMVWRDGAFRLPDPAGQ